MDYFPTETRANFQLKAAENGKHPLLSPVSPLAVAEEEEKEEGEKDRGRGDGRRDCMSKRRGGGRRGRGGRGWDN